MVTKFSLILFLIMDQKGFERLVGGKKDHGSILDRMIISWPICYARPVGDLC